MSKAKVNDIEIYYEIHGRGTPLVMIQGWGYSSEMWSPEFIRNFSKFHRVIIFDNRGTGRSSKPDIEYSIKMMADDVAGLMEAIKVPKAHVLGASMGAMIAQELALNHPEKVKSLILCMATCGGPHSVPVPVETQKAMFTTANPPPDMPMEEVLELWWSLLYSPSYIQEHRDELMKEALSVKYPTPIIGKKRQAEAVLTFDTYDRLPDIRAPTLIMAGKKDVIVPSENSRILAERIPGAKLRLFKDSPHGFLREKEKEAVTEILNFLAEA
ncbi:MAG: alpha/beta fold hydrolase [Candidatus Lokiarchaeia archaeon]